MRKIRSKALVNGFDVQLQVRNVVALEGNRFSLYLESTVSPENPVKELRHFAKNLSSSEGNQDRAFENHDGTISCIMDGSCRNISNMGITGSCWQLLQDIQSTSNHHIKDQNAVHQDVLVFFFLFPCYDLEIKRKKRTKHMGIYQ